MSDILQQTIAAAQPDPSANPLPAAQAQANILQQTIVAAGGQPSGPVPGEGDIEGTQLRATALAQMTDQTFQQQIDDRSRAVDFFHRLNPAMTRDQVLTSLPQLYESLTGQKHNDSRTMVDGIGDAWDRFWKSVESEDTFRFNDQIQGGADTAQGLLQLLFPNSGSAQVLKEEIKSAAASEDTKAKARVQKLDEAVSKTAVTEGGQWWLGAVDNSTQLVGSLTYVGREAAAGALIAGGGGAGAAGWNASARLMSNSSYRTMRERGVDRDIADLSSNVIGYSAASVELLGLGGVAKVALTPLVKKAIMSSIPAVARAVASGSLKAGAATVIGTTEEVIQEGISIAGENEAYKAQNNRTMGEKLARAMEATNLAGTEVEAAVLASILEYNRTALVPLDHPEDIARRLKDTAVNSAMGMAVLGGLGGIGGTVADLRTIKEWDKAGVLREKASDVARDVQTARAITEAEPQPSAEVKTSVANEAGEAITVYHPADQALAAGRGSLSDYGNGVRFFTDRESAELEARAMSTGPLSAEGLVSALKKQYPDQLVQAVQAVIQQGREAEAPFTETLKAWNENNPTMDYAQILDLAESIHDGSSLTDRNDIVRQYGLEEALPAGGIVEAKIQAENIARVDNEHEIAKAFKDGAEAVEFDGTWYVKDADRVVVTAKTESRAESAVRTPVGKMSFQANDNTVRALAEDGTEAGRVKVTTDGSIVRLQGLVTAESFRRQGVARALVDRIVRQNPGKTIDWGDVKTDEGRAFQGSVRRSMPTWGQWGSRIEDAEASGDQARAEFLRQKADTIPDPQALLGDGAPLNRDQLFKILSKGMTYEEAEAAVAIIARMAQASGRDLDTFLARALETVEWVESVKDGSGTVRQSANGAAILGATGKRLIQLVQGRANVTTVLHEMAHALRPLLSAQDQDSLLEWTGESEWNRAAEERFARGFEQYLGEGQSVGDTKIDEILAKVTWWFRMIYDALFNDPAFTVDGKPVELSEGVRDVYQRILEGRKGLDAVDATGWSEPLFQEEVETLLMLDETPQVKGGSSVADGETIKTPIGPVKIGENQSQKLAGKGREGQGHLIRPTLEDPTLVIRDDRGGTLYVKHFLDGGTKAFVAVTVSIEGIQIKISAHFKKIRDLVKKGKTGQVAYIKPEIRAQFPGGNLTIASTPKHIVTPESKDVKGDSETLFQDDATTLKQALAEKQKKLETFRAARDSHIEALSKGKTQDERRAVETVVDEYLTNLAAEVEADRAAVDAYRSTAGKPSARREAIQQAVAAGKPVPDAWVQEFEAEPWARDELARRADLRDQLDMARSFDSLDDYLAAIVEDRMLQAMGDPFESVMSEEEWTAAEAKARDDATIMPEDFDRFSQVYAIAHAKTPEQLDREFSESLTPDKVKMILAGMNQGAYIADKNLPRHITAQVTKSYEGGQVDEGQIPRILKTMKNDPRTYRRIAQQGYPDLAELEALAVEQEVEKATRAQAEEEAPPVIKPIEIPSDMTIEDKVAIRVGTKSRMEWQRKALDAEKELTNLDRVLGILERLSDKWTVKVEEKEQPDYSAQDLADLAELAQLQTVRLQSALRALVIDSGKDRAQQGDRTAKLILDLVKLVRSEMKTKEAARRAYYDQAEAMRKMGAYLSKPAPKTIHVEYARKIEQNRDLIDPHFRTMKKSELLALEAEWYAAHPDIPVPRTRRGELYGKNLNLWTYEELHAAYLNRKALEEMGRGKMIAKKLVTENRRFLLRQKIIDAIYNEEEVLQAKIRQAEESGDQDKKAKLARRYLEWSMRKAENLQNLNDQKAAEVNRGGLAVLLTTSNLADMLDGGADYKGPNHEILWSDPNKAENSFLRETNRRKTAMIDWVKEHGINLAKLKDRVKINHVSGSFSYDALLTVYVGDKNELKRKALLHGNRIDHLVFDYVNRTDSLQWLRDLGDQIIREYEDNKDRLFDVAEEYENVDMRTREQESYTPMIRTEVTQEGLDQQLQWEAGMAMSVRKAKIEHGFTEARIDVGDDHQKPIKMGEFTQWLEMVTKQEQYIAFTPIIKDLTAIYESGDVKDAITQTHGSRVLGEVDSYIKSLANRYNDRTYTGIDRVMQKLSQHAALAYMAYNLATAMKQVSSLPLFIAHTRPDLLVRSMAKMAVPWVLIRKVNRLSIQMRTRVPYAEFEDILLKGNLPAKGKNSIETSVRAGLNTTESAMVKVASPGMKPMQWIDKLVAAAGWDASFETARAKGMTEESAIEYADWVVGKTQQTTSAKDGAGITRMNNTLMKALMLFAGPGVKVYNELVYGTKANLKNGHYLKSMGTLLGVSASAIVFYAIGAGRPPEEEEWSMWTLAGLVNNVPVLGGALAAFIQGYDPGNIILSQAIGSASDTARSLSVILNEETTDERKAAAWPRAVRSGLDVIGLGFGAPVSPVKRVWKAAETGNPGELVGWHEKK